MRKTRKSSASFRFKQFEVFHDRCAMKVGTDGVLLGAWVFLGEANRILDVGAGCGLIALILAQRSQAQVDGVELDAQAAAQAVDNIRNSPWSDRMQIFQSDFSVFSNGPYDLIVSNPPFFRNSLKAPHEKRNQARHTDVLSHQVLVEKSSQMLSKDGRFCVILPSNASEYFEDICWQSCLYLSRRCEVIPVEGHMPKRVLLEFSPQHLCIERTTLTLETKDRIRTTAFSTLMSDLYLDN